MPCLLWLAGGLTLLVGGVGILNATLVSVLERRWEIGLRMALGATRSSVVTQTLVESAVIGGVGALVGSSLGMVAVAIVASRQGWPIILPDVAVLLGPPVGLFIGLLAGVYPAVRAASIEPAEALRR